MKKKEYRSPNLNVEIKESGVSNAYCGCAC